MRVGIFLAITAPVLVSAQQTLWGQCGGIGWTGPTNCVSGAACATQNPYYAQCISASGQTTTRTTTGATTSRTTTTTTSRTTTGSQPAGTGLDTLIKSKGKKYVGFAADSNTLNVAQIANIIKTEGGCLTGENSMKWDATEPSQGTFNWGGADTLVNFAQANGKLVRGHTLLWHSQLPQWVKNINNKATLTTVIQNHAAAVAGRYKGKIYAWDVANEVVADGGGMRSSVFSQVFGDWTFLDVAFRAAKAADPSAKLCLNDYNINYSGAKLNTFVQVVRDLKARGVPIDCVGTQTHTGVGASDIANYKSTLTTLAGTGCEVQITELDIATPSTAISTALLNQQRNDYKTIVSACMTTSACTGITLWGVSDQYTWITGRHPLLWDENFQKKPAYQGFVDGINS
ncbi:Exoglucanase [Dactylella cylindrospora]|nr:Exoglucanase [Dactylella cylindrospora]